MSSSTAPPISSPFAGGVIPGQTILLAHAALMCVAFVLLFPLAALTVRLPYAKRVTRLHAPWQLFNLTLAVTGAGLGITVAKKRGVPIAHTPHTILGLVVVGCLLTIQPGMGLMQHYRSQKTASRSVFGWVHLLLGRLLLILGVVNGGRGFPLAYDRQYKAYIVVAAVVGAFYIAVLVWDCSNSRRQINKKRDRAEGGQGTNEGVVLSRME